MNYLCTEAADYLVYQPCYSSTSAQSGFSRCDAIQQAKTNYPYNYNYYYGSCFGVTNTFKCYYNAAVAACNTTAAYSLAVYSAYYYQLWQGSNCFSDLNSLLNASSQVCEVWSTSADSSATNSMSVSTAIQLAVVKQHALQTPLVLALIGISLHFPSVG
jgi:hypothetical protein